MLKLGILGLGTVGSGVIKILSKNSKNIKNKVGTELTVKKILVNNLKKERNVDVPQELLTKDVTDILDDPEIDIVVELIGGENPAYEYIIKAIEKGKSIVTANKLVIAKYGRKIFKKAYEFGVQISFEGSVAGGLPIIRPLQNSLAANRIDKIYGVLNGTTNYILTRMSKENKDFESSLAKAKRLGYAESDPGSDIEGHDAAYKITILSLLAFERYVDVDSIYVEGIKNIDSYDIALADEMGFVIKLLAVAKNTGKGLDIRVHPAFVPQDHPLSMINGTYNCVYLHGDAVGQVMSMGKGAGQMPTGSAVVADIIQTGKYLNYNKTVINVSNTIIQSKMLNIKDVKNNFYIRLNVKDRPGVMARIANIFGNNKVSLASVLQKNKKEPVVPLVFITHTVSEKHLYNSIEKIKNLEDVKEVNSVIRVENNI